MFEMILEKRFEKLPGYKKVLKREYAIEEGISGNALSRNREWSACLRPGQKVDMSMAFSDTAFLASTCPGCGTESSASVVTRTQW